MYKSLMPELLSLPSDLRRAIDMGCSHQSPCLVGQRHHRREYFGICHQPVQMMFAPRPRAMETRLAGKRVPGSDIRAKHVNEGGVAAGDISCPDNTHPLALDSPAGEAGVVAELVASRAWLTDSARRVVVPRGLRGDDLMVGLRNPAQPAKCQGKPELGDRLSPVALGRVADAANIPCGQDGSQGIVASADARYLP